MGPSGTPAVRIVTYDKDGAKIGDFLAEVGRETPEFFAHQALHADGVTCVEVLDPESLGGTAVILRRCDPGLDFDDSVVAPLGNPGV